MRRAKGDTAGTKRLVWFSEIQWDFLSTRKQRLLQRFPPEWEILFVEPVALGRKQHWLPVRRGRVTVVTVPFLKRVPQRLVPILESLPARVLISLVGRLIFGFWASLLGFGSGSRVIGLSNIWWGSVAASLRCRLRFYDANDDHLAFTHSPGWLRKSQRRYLDVCDLCFSVSPELLERLGPGPETRCVELGNGVDSVRFSTPAPKPARLAVIPGPILGYVGAMDWLDTELVGELARAWPGYGIVLVGPAYDRGWAGRNAALLSLPNLHWMGKVAYAEVPAWVQGFDLALMPLERSELKGASHPNKLYEYAAAGVPVLAIDYCSAVRSARHVVTVAGSAAEFVRLVPEAMADSRREARQAFARGHDWDALAAQMSGELLAALERRNREA